MSNETWLPVAGYEGLYEVSNLGRVRSVARKNTKGGVMRPRKDHVGYLRVHLSKNGKKKMHSVHRLGATAYIPNPLGLPEVNHKNEIKTDNHIENLEWCDRYYNCTYGSLADKIREVYQYNLDGTFVAWYPSITEAARRTGVSAGAISTCASGKRKTQDGYQWRCEPALFLDPTEGGQKNNANSKRVYQYSLDGRFVKEWVSTMEIQRQTGWSNNSISDCARGARKSSHGFCWFYSFQGLRINVSPNPQD